MRLVILTIALLFCFSCNSDKQEERNQALEKEKVVSIPNQVDPHKKHFYKFIKNFKPTGLPYVFRVSNKDTFNIDLSKLVNLNSNTADTSLIKSDYYDGVYCYGILADSSKFYSLLFFFSADDYYPVLATYSKAGKLINQEPLTVNGCGSDCGLTYCSRTTFINKDFSISSVDTIRYDFHCDEEGDLVNEGLLMVDSKRGKVNKEGEIEMEKVNHYKKSFISDKPLPKS